MVWEFEAKLRPARAKRPDQLRWRLDGLLECKANQAAYAKCAEDRGVLKGIAKGAYAPGYSTDDMEGAIVAELQEIARIQLGEQVKVPGEGRVKAHTWRVTKAYRAKSIAGSALKRCRSTVGGGPPFRRCRHARRSTRRPAEPSLR